MNGTEFKETKKIEIVRPTITAEDVQEALRTLQDRMLTHLEKYGDGVFVHPHESTGCLFGQLMKLSTAADASVYSGDTKDFEERLLKTALPTVFAIASVRKLRGE